MGWCELRDALASHVPSTVIQLGKKFSHLQQYDDHVTLHFTEGAPVDAKTVLGADGIFSRVRQQTLNDGLPDFTVRIMLLLAESGLNHVLQVTYCGIIVIMHGYKACFSTCQNVHTISLWRCR